MKITKDQFVACIEAMRRQDEETNKRLAFMNRAGFEWEHDYFYTENALVKLLQELTCDEFKKEIGMSYIEFFCFESNFGETGFIKTPEQLYNLLDMQYKHVK